MSLRSNSLTAADLDVNGECSLGSADLVQSNLRCARGVVAGLGQWHAVGIARAEPTAEFFERGEGK